ncbi:MAG: tetratricopeptide repeat protein [Arenicella sp.]|nr:tetratricopeptide repeat protein [Arenicella sp.]
MSNNIEQLLSDAQTSLQKNDRANAASLYQQALQQDPESTSALFGLGSCFMQQAQFREALELFEKARELEPEAVDIAYNYARCLAELGNRYAALVELQRVTQYVGEDPVFCPIIADLLVKLGEGRGAIELLARMSQLTPAHQIILARANGLAGDWQEAVRLLFRLSEEIPDDARAANELATAAGYLRDYPIAIMAFQRYLKAVTPRANDYLRFADLLLLSKQVERSEQSLKLAVEQGEDSSELHALKAKIARLKGDYEVAMDASREAIDRSPRHGQAWLTIAELAPAEQLEALVAELQAMLAQPPAEPRPNQHFEALLRYSLAHAHDCLEQYQAASGALREANEIQQAQLANRRGAYSAEQTEQFISGLIESYNADVLELPTALANEDKRKLRPIFIVGMPRSGTTLVERILGQADQVTTGGELEGMQLVATEYRKRVELAQLPPPAKMTVDQWQGLRSAYLDKAPEDCSSVLTDKLPANFHNVGLILKLFPEAKISSCTVDWRTCACQSIHSRFRWITITPVTCRPVNITTIRQSD